MDTSNSANVSLTDLEESRMKSKSARSIQHSLSKAMAEALYQPNTMTQPKPIAQRVKDAGKDFLRHNQTCQWIQFMQEEPPLSAAKKEQLRLTKISLDREVLPVIKDSACPADREREVPLSLSLESPSPSFEEQLRTVHRQQEVLLEQQHILEEQMEQQKKTMQMASLHELQPKSVLSEISSMKDVPSATYTRTRTDVSNSPSCPPSRFKRRLKGCIARSFAERDEGSIGSLLYNTGQDSPSERKSCTSNSSYTNSTRPSHEGRQYGLSQDSGSNISQVLSQVPYCSSFDIIKNASEASATMADIMLTDRMLKERKSDDHVDF